ncbi:MAG: histidine kinase [Bacteroidota bacterium]
MKKIRFALYLSIAALVTVIDFMNGIRDKAPQEELFLAVYALPTVLGVCYLQYYIRRWVLASPQYGRIRSRTMSFRWLFWSILVIALTLFLSITARFMSSMILPNYESGVFFDFLYWSFFTVTLCICLFVHAMESFIELHQEKQTFQLRLKEYENEKLISKFLNLKKQLNPHFLFNSFNSLSGLIHGHPEKAEYFVSELSNIYRYTLDQSDELVVPLERELGLIRSYVALQKIRFGESLKVTYNIAPEALKKMLPPMTLELLIENAIKHNVVELERPLEVMVHDTGDCVVVTNNYQPRTNFGQSSDSTQLGLKNLKNQYRMIHTIEPRFNVRNGKYVAVIPLIEPE